MKEPTLSPEQEAVMSDIMEGRNVLITGAAGTGKSTILRELNRRFNGKLAIAGSTGLAAVNVGGMTLHSWAALGLGDEPASVIAETVFNRRKAKARVVNSPRLAIDEISMIHGDLFDTLEEVFRLVREDHRPFGGMQMILFGDFCQLPPVSPGKESRFAFQTEAWKRANFRTHVLTQVFRQADAKFSRLLNEIRIGNLTPEVLQMLRARMAAVDPSPEIEPVAVYTHNRDVDSHNQSRLDKIQGKEEVFYSRDEGEPNALKTLQKNCLAPAELKLKVGAQVMLLWNVAPESGMANGSIGKVVSFDRSSNVPQVRFPNGQVLSCDKAEWSIRSDGEPIATRRQIPLRLAYSCSAHKAQGMTLDKVAVHLERAFDYGQSYVALSRVKTLEGLFIRSSKIGCIKAHPDAVKFYAEQP